MTTRSLLPALPLALLLAALAPAARPAAAQSPDALVAATDRSYDPVRRLFGADGAAAALIARFAR